MMEMIRKITNENHANVWLYLSDEINPGIELGPIYSKRIIKQWEEEGEVIGHRIRGNNEEWFHE